LGEDDNPLLSLILTVLVFNTLDFLQISMGETLQFIFITFYLLPMYGGNSFTKIVKLPNNGHFVMLLETTRGYCD
jgi:hypothetical protein